MFETSDTLSLAILVLSSDLVKTYLENFVPSRWWGRSFNALAYLPSFKMDMKKNKKEKEKSLVYDAIYVANNKNHPLLVMYVTPHIIFSHIDSGQSTLDILYRSPLDFENIAVSPKYKFRSYDNKSVEFVICHDDKMKVKSRAHPTLGLFREKERQNFPTGRLLNKYLEFVDKIHQFFSCTQYLPYIVHPYRLILFEEEELKLISCNLIQYIYHPYMKFRKVIDIHFSYPDFTSDYTSPAEMLTRNSVLLVLDFLHSVFVTAMWITRPIEMKEITRNHTYNDDDDDDDDDNNNDNNKKNKGGKRKRKLESIDHFWIEPVILSSSSSSSSNSSSSSSTIKRRSLKCRNPYGYCHVMKNDLVHDYGCSHLLKLAPAILINAVNNASEKEDKTIFTECVSKEISLIKSFISEIIKNNGDDFITQYST